MREQVTAAHRATAPPRILGPILLMVLGLCAAIAFSFAFTTWAIDSHSREACTELRILATAPGAQTAYDQTVKREYQHLYALRCG